MERDVLVTKLVVGVAVSPHERRMIGSFVTRAEVARAIARELERHGRFPWEREGHGGLQLVLEGERVRLVSGRFSGGGPDRVCLRAEAIERYIDGELGPCCGGVPIRPVAMT
jgi:hypothetical protein